MPLATVVKTIRDFATGLQVNLTLLLFSDGGTASLHGTLDSNGVQIDPATDEGAMAIHTALQAIIAKQTPPSS